MRKRSAFAYGVLYASQLLRPVLNGFGCRLDTNETVYAALCALIGLAAAVATRAEAGAEKSAARNVADLLLIPVAFWNFVLCVRVSVNPAALLCMLVSFGCCLIVSLTNNHRLVFKSLSAVLAILLILPTLLVSFASWFGATKVVRSVDAPSGSLYAEVIVHDQGALGGSVEVAVSRRIAETPVFTLSARQETVYDGPWRDFRDMDLYWKDDACLVIDSTAYPVGGAG